MFDPARPRSLSLGGNTAGGAVATTARIATALRRGCDFNFFKHVFLDSADLFETNELQEREKRYHDFHARYGSPEQVGKT